VALIVNPYQYDSTTNRPSQWLKFRNNQAYDGRTGVNYSGHGNYNLEASSPILYHKGGIKASHGLPFDINGRPRAKNGAPGAIEFVSPTHLFF
jgi:hypothetical protein